MSCNIFDNVDFFNSYKQLRETDDNFNILLEQPAMMKLLPEIKDRAVLDLGCGFGDNCFYFADNDAEKVVGVDISEKMLSLASEKNSHKNIRYINMSMADISSINEKFDLIYSSLVFHYIEDFKKLCKDMHNLLNKNGVLLFSQEHPIVTSSINESNHYLRNDTGEAVSYCISNYSDRGLRRDTWFVDGVEKYHRTFGDIINAVADAGFVIEKIEEPMPSDEALFKRPGLKKEFIKPTFLIVKAQKHRAD